MRLCATGRIYRSFSVYRWMSNFLCLPMSQVLAAAVLGGPGAQAWTSAIKHWTQTRTPSRSLSRWSSPNHPRGSSGWSEPAWSSCKLADSAITCQSLGKSLHWPVTSLASNREPGDEWGTRAASSGNPTWTKPLARQTLRVLFAERAVVKSSIVRVIGDCYDPLTKKDAR